MGTAGTSGVQSSEAQIPLSGQSALQNKPEVAVEGSEDAELRAVDKAKVRLNNRTKATAIDKQYHYVAALQLRNRQRAAQQQQEEAQQQAQQQQLSGFSQRLRATILAGDHEALQQTWKPAAAAACLKDLQQTAAQQTQELLERLSVRNSSLTGVFNPHTLRFEHALTASTALDMPSNANGESKAIVAAAPDEVDTFLDSLLQQAAVQKASSQDHKPVASRAENATVAQSAGVEEQKRVESVEQAAVPETAVATSISRPCTARPASSKQPSPMKPAWARSEQQQAESEAAAEAAEEAELLEFAEQLDWQEIISKLDDGQLADAFKELEVADAAAAAGDSSADKHWRASFVTALNHAALKDVAAAGSSAEADTLSEVPSTASHTWRAEEKAGRRQKLLDRLSRLQGNNGTSVLLGDTVKAGSTAAPGSTAGDRASLFGGSAGFSCVAPVAAGDDWDCSTRCGGDNVQAIQQQLKVLEASDVLAENPEMKGVHSVASIKSMLQRRDVL